ncbi:GNAT family N-acetyltransferase [Streptomyces sp. NPDC058195]|uniref:GNAT family N-acetyltransferase n=1 Tax=Streptomyces sp. NPDC058195 TaxID=3346375 RepID=UPI0036E3E8C2
MRVTVRAVRGGDWDAVVALEAAAYGAAGLSEGRAALESRAAASPATCFVLDHGSRTAGYLLALPYPMFAYPDLDRTEDVVFHSRNLHLHDLVIAEDLRGRGLGRVLLGRLVAVAGTKGYGTVSLVAVGGSDTFWAASGFRPHRDVTPPAGYGADAVYMSLAVPDVRGGRTDLADAPSHQAPMKDEVG